MCESRFENIFSGIKALSYRLLNHCEWKPYVARFLIAIKLNVSLEVLASSVKNKLNLPFLFTGPLKLVFTDFHLQDSNFTKNCDHDDIMTVTTGEESCSSRAICPPNLLASKSKHTSQLMSPFLGTIK